MKKILSLIVAVTIVITTFAGLSFNLFSANAETYVPVGEELATPAATPAATPVATPGATPAATPNATPVATPVATPAATPNSTPVVTPYVPPQIAYEVSNGEATIVDIRFYGEVVVIPSTIDGYPVTRIGRNLFYGENLLTSITIPNSVTSIDEGAFFSCNALKSITIPDNVTSIGYRAFADCSNLTTVNFNAVNCTSMGSHNYPVFKGCTKLTTINIGDNVTKIPAYAFYYCSSLTSVTIPNSVTNIGNCAFSGCSSLTSVTIPDSVTSIGNWAFAGCNSLTSVTIPDSVTSIGNWAFEGCSSLTSVTIGNSVTSIGSYAFYGCSKLTSVTIPDSVTSIGDEAFCACSSLTSITIPNSVTSIGSGAFSYCTSLESITVSEDNIVYYSEDNCLIEKETKTLIAGCKNSIIPNGVKKVGYYAFYGIIGYKNLTLPESVIEVELRSLIAGDLESITVANGNAVYYSENNCLIEKETKMLVLGCNNSIIPDDVTGIYDEAFFRCSLTSINIPASVTYMGEGAFWDCAVKEVHITDVSAWCKLDIGDGGGYGPLCRAQNLYLNGVKVENLVIPEGVSSIGEGTFAGCTNIKSVTIPNTVTDIGYCAFNDCSSLTTVYYLGSEDEKANITIDGDYNQPLINATWHYNICVDGHKYTNACDNECNVCFWQREIEHTYTNNCDTKCNICGFVRKTEHNYDGVVCTVCGALDTLNCHSIIINVAITGEFDASGISIIANGKEIIPTINGDVVSFYTNKNAQIKIRLNSFGEYVPVGIKYTGSKGNILGVEEYSFVAYGTKTDLTIEYNLAEENQIIKLFYVNENGNQVFFDSFAAGSNEIQRLNNYPTLYKKVFKEFKINGNVYKDAEEVLAAINALSQEEVFVQVVYVVDADEAQEGYKIAINKDMFALTKDGKEIDGTVSPFTLINFTAYANNGTANFAYWADENGNIISYNRVYTRYITSDVNIRPVYSDKPVEKAAINITVADNYGKLVVVAERSLSEELEILEHGIIIAEYGTDTLTLEDVGETEGGKVYLARRVNNEGSVLNNGTYILTKGNKHSQGGKYTQMGTTLSFVAFVRYIAEDGEEKVMYSQVGKSLVIMTADELPGNQVEQDELD